MIKKLMLGTAIAIALCAMNAQALELGKPIKTTITVNKPGTQGMVTTKKDIFLMNIKLTPKQQQMLMNYSPKKAKASFKTDSTLPSSVQLGMNNVPVLDQGWHGTCVTFATTAALDAVLGKGDYISQLCNLELGNYLESESYMPSGWDGSFGGWILDQTMRFGIINKYHQQANGCAGLKEYPQKDYSEGNAMTPDEYKNMSEDLENKIYYVPLMNFFDRWDKHFTDTDQSEMVLTKTKEALNKGNRLTFGTFLVVGPYCNAGACAKFHKNEDTWALTKELETPPYFTAGHEMIITGYDDNAEAVDKDGKKHLGLLTLRNSWGEEAGDGGNYYMTYDYFKKFADEVQEIGILKDF